MTTPSSWTRIRSTLLAACAVFCLATTSFAAPVLLEQSPIDIRSEDAQFAVLDPLIFNYGTSVPLDVTNVNSPNEFGTVRANVSPGAGSVSVGGLQYNLLQFHFHSESEHWLNGHPFDMELHFVHQAADGTLLVVGRFIEIGAPNAALAPIFSNLPQLPGDHVAIPSFDLNALLPTDFHSFRYPGSLTTPPFTEGVKWNVLAAPPIEMSLEQVNAFRALFPEGDAREVQPLNGRVVLTDVAGFATPEPATLALVGFALSSLLMIGHRRRKGPVTNS